MFVGYVRVSTEEQNEGRQIEMMKSLNVEKLFCEKVSGKSTEGRTELKALLDFVREGDIVVIESYSRLARNTKDLLEIVEQLEKKGVAFKSLKESVDTNTPSGRLMLSIFASLAQFEREQTLQRQREGIEIAKREGRYTGRKPLALPEGFDEVVAEWKKGKIKAVEAMAKLNLSKSTFYRMVKCSESRN